MSQMISVASGFQYSVNIGFDLNNDDKLRNFIPTKSSITLLEDILHSTAPSSTERSRVLIGAYGKGKSHIVLMILSLLMKKKLSLFEQVLPQIEKNPRLYQMVENYYDAPGKILPVVITGSSTSLTQAFLNALQRTLSENDLLDVMPDTNYKAAVSVINRWKDEFPETYLRLETILDMPVSVFVDELSNYSITAYEKFEKIYPTLTSGSVFNPFLGFDVVDLYEQVAIELKSKGYSGIYVVYDEFSKFLEANIVEASLSDTKMLQDFAEKCNRSGDTQLHLMLICHKDISNYIDKLPKQKVDGWRGVSERFKHIRLSNNFTQTYGIISSVIKKDSVAWERYKLAHEAEFSAELMRYKNHPAFTEIKNGLETAVWGCFPLSPSATFILPRISEKVAQNERTLFTFLSAEGNSTLTSFLAGFDDSCFKVITPDLIYDYFEPLIKKEPYGSSIHNCYMLTCNVLTHLTSNELGAKIVKTISLIYIIEQFERIEPTREELIGVYENSYSIKEIDEAIKELIEREFVVYLKRSNNYLRLKQTSGVDIRQQISDTVLLQADKVSMERTLNKVNSDAYIYPARYNDEREMTRYFTFVFVEENNVLSEPFEDIMNGTSGDGVVCGILVRSEENIPQIMDAILKLSVRYRQIIFAIPKHFHDIEQSVRDYNAVIELRGNTGDDQVLFDEYDIVYEDLYEVISGFISSYTHPEKYETNYIYCGENKNIHRKAALTELLSKVCDDIFCYTPVINNEAVNKDEITNVSTNSRNKIVAALLRNDLEANLGLTGSGQEVSIMRSTLVRTGIWSDNPIPRLNMCPDDENISRMLRVIENHVLNAREGSVSFDCLYNDLTGTAGHIGLRKGLIPIYLAVVIHEYKQQLVVSDRYGPVQISVDTLAQINSDPSGFSMIYLDWDPEKEQYVNSLSGLFNDYIIDAEKGSNSYDYVAKAMKRWFLSLPKYAKENKISPDGTKLDKRYTAMARMFRTNPNSYEMLFTMLPKAFGYAGVFNQGLSENIAYAKSFYDNLTDNLKDYLVDTVKGVFALPSNAQMISKMSLSSVIADWCDSLDPKAFEQLFSDGTNKCLELFRTVTNDERAFVSRLAKLATDLRIEDWDDDTYARFVNNIKQYKTTASNFVSEDVPEHLQGTSAYQMTFVDENGTAVTKRFNKVEFSKRGKLLYKPPCPHA